MWWEASNTLPSVGETPAPQASEKMSGRCLLGSAISAPGRYLAPGDTAGKKKSRKSYLRADAVITSVNNRGLEVLVLSQKTLLVEACRTRGESQ